MFKTIFVLTAILIGASVGAAQAVQRSTKQQAWDLGHNLSLAALGHAEGGASAAVDRLLAKAKGNARTFGVTIPDLPAKTTDKASNRAEALVYLLRKVGGPMGGGERPGLPEYLTADLLRLVAANADFGKVKASVFKMHADVAKYLAKTK